MEGGAGHEVRGTVLPPTSLSFYTALSSSFPSMTSSFSEDGGGEEMGGGGGEGGGEGEGEKVLYRVPWAVQDCCSFLERYCTNTPGLFLSLDINLILIF